MERIQHIRWDDFFLSGSIVDDAGTVIDLTWSTVKYWLSYSKGRNPFYSSDAIITANEYSIHIDNTITSLWDKEVVFLDIQLTDSNGYVSTVGQIAIDVLPDIIQ